MNAGAGALLAGVLVLAAVAVFARRRGVTALQQIRVVPLIALAAAGFVVGSAAGSKTVAVATYGGAPGTVQAPGASAAAPAAPAPAPTVPAATAATIDPAAPRGGGHAQVSLDAFDDAAAPRATVRNPLDLASRARLLLVGWAFDATAKTPCARVLTIVDGGPRAFALVYGGPRPDVASSLRDTAATAVGFAGTIDAAQLASGTHRVAIICLDARGNIAARTNGDFTVNVR